MHKYTVFFLPYCDHLCQKLSHYGKKILYTYVYYIVYYPRKCEALHEITDFVHEMMKKYCLETLHERKK